MHSGRFLLIELFGGSISVHSHEAHRNYKLKVLFSNFVEAWLWIGCVPVIGPCSNPWACTVNWEGHAHRGLFFPTLFFPKLLLFSSNPWLSSFHAIIGSQFLLICLQQYAWNRDKHLLAPNPDSEYIGISFLHATWPDFAARVPLVLIGCSAEAGSNIELRANSTKPCVFYYILLSGL